MWGAGDDGASKFGVCVRGDGAAGGGWALCGDVVMLRWGLAWVSCI